MPILEPFKLGEAGRGKGLSGRHMSKRHRTCVPLFQVALFQTGPRESYVSNMLCNDARPLAVTISSHLRTHEDEHVSRIKQCIEADYESVGIHLSSHTVLLTSFMLHLMDDAVAFDCNRPPFALFVMLHSISLTASTSISKY